MGISIGSWRTEGGENKRNTGNRGNWEKVDEDYKTWYGADIEIKERKKKLKWREWKKK